jgi:formamidopyrimidine-DNA glycosylase
MPELPEVETIVRDLNKTVKGLKITDFWIDQEKTIKQPAYRDFVKQIKNKKILKARRRAKYVLIDLSGNKTIIIHQKMSGHLLYGKWARKISPLAKSRAKEIKTISLLSGSLKNDPQNRFIRLIFYLNNGKQLGLSDLRRFAKVLLFDTDKIKELEEIKKLGPEPLEKDFTLNKFKEIFEKFTHRKGKAKIKQVLMDQNVIAGIGNIYSDEILFEAKIHPLRPIEKTSEDDLRKIYQAIKKILQRAIALKGDSMSDYRMLNGKKGGYQEIQKVYQRDGEKCYRCEETIKRIKISGRSAHFCPACQRLTA